MIPITKVTLSVQEKQLISNSDWILTKCSIINKVIELLNILLDSFRKIVEENKYNSSAELQNCYPKISKGENYLSLPYVILDYPRFFDRQNIFVIRTMFWWGNFFSCTLHLKGLYKQAFKNIIIQNIKNAMLTDLYICINEDEWHHHFERSNYKKVADLTIHEIGALIKKQPFIKVAYLFSLEQWDNLSLLLPEKFKELLVLITKPVK